MHHWRTYVVPVVLTSFVAVLFAYLGLRKLGIEIGGVDPLRALPASISPAVLAGAGGAYLWGLQDIVRRHGTADLSSTAFHHTWLRMTMAASIGALLDAMNITPQVSIVTAFAAGAIPMRRLWAIVEKRANITVPEDPAWPSDLHLIQGLTKDTRERLILEEIHSIAHLAFADPVRLLFRTNIEWNVILDMIDQALLVNYVGPKIDKLRELGIRGAIEFAEPMTRLEEEDDVTPRETANAKKILEAAGEALGQTYEAAFNLSYQLRHDPVVGFIWEHYAALYSAEEDEPAPSLPVSERLIGALKSKVG
jgi:hypothetical protein